MQPSRTCPLSFQTSPQDLRDLSQAIVVNFKGAWIAQNTLPKKKKKKKNYKYITARTQAGQNGNFTKITNKKSNYHSKKKTRIKSSKYIIQNKPK